MGNHVLQMFASAFVAVLALAGAGTGVRVSAQTRHVLAGDDVGSWLSGRVFRVGDKISFNSGTEDSFVELKAPEEFDSCDLTNPIKMYTGATTHVELEKEGTRYFTSANPESCNKEIKLPVSVQSHEYWLPTPQYGPPEHVQPPPEEYVAQPPPEEYAQPPPEEHAQPPPEEHAQPPPEEHAQPPPEEHAQPPPEEHAQPPPEEYAQPPPEHAQPPPEEYAQPPPEEYAQPPPEEHAQPPPEEYAQPPPEHGPPEPVQPPPVFGPPPPPRTPSGANYLNGLSFALFAGLLVCSIGM